MSRNLGRTSCAICESTAIATQAPRALLPSEAGRQREEYEKKCLMVADARCTICGTRYLAWVCWIDGSGRPVNPIDPALGAGARHDPFIDLSFWSHFDDEPSSQDLPPANQLRQIEDERRRIEVLRLRKRSLEFSPGQHQLHLLKQAKELEDQIGQRSPWERYLSQASQAPQAPSTPSIAVVASGKRRKTLQEIYAAADARLSAAEREAHAVRVDQSIVLIQSGWNGLPPNTGIARSLLDDAISELRQRARDLRGKE